MRWMLESLIFTAIFWSSTAKAATHSYKIPKIAETKEHCQVVERSIVDQFSVRADASILSHSCQQNLSGSFDLVIEYVRPALLNLVSTYKEFGAVHGLYESAEECAAHYDQEKNTFKVQTGIEPLIAYCFKDSMQSDPLTLWAMRIDGFGDPKKSPRHISKEFYHNIVDDIGVLESELVSALEAFGADGTNVKIVANDRHAKLYAMYYAEKDLPIIEYNQGQFSNIESCEQNRDIMQEIFAKSGGRSAIYFCGAMPYSSTYYVYSLGLIIQPLASDLSTLRYQDFADCEAQRSEAEVAWRNDLRKNVVGSLCSMDNPFVFERFFRMRIFWLE
jgi:hypothetical protein